MPKSIMTLDALAVEIKGQLGAAPAATLTPTGTTQTVDLNNGSVVTIDLHSATGDVTLTVNNPRSGYFYWFKYIQRITTPYQPVYPGTFSFGGLQPKISAINDSVTTHAFYYDGTNFVFVPDAPMVAADLTALASYNPGRDGAVAYVLNPGDFYILDITNSYTPDALGVIAATGGGYWISQTVGRWEDLQAEPSQGTGGAALTYVVWRDTPFKVYTMNHGQDDELHFRFQLPHRWRAGTDVKFHLHAAPTSDPASTLNAYFIGQYNWCKAGEAIPADASWTDLTPVSFPVAVGDVYKSKLASIVTITPPSGAKESDVLLIYIQRNGTSGSDTYLGNLAILSADLHYRVGKHGTVTETP